VDGD